MGRSFHLAYWYDILFDVCQEQLADYNQRSRSRSGDNIFNL